jgi:hypothetical protein
MDNNRHVPAVWILWLSTPDNIVQKKSGGEVVAGVNDYARAQDQICDGCRDTSLGDRNHFKALMLLFKRPFHDCDFGLPEISFRVQHLAMKIAECHIVIICDAYPATPRRCQDQSRWDTYPSRSNDQDFLRSPISASDHRSRQASTHRIRKIFGETEVALPRVW